MDGIIIAAAIMGIADANGEVFIELVTCANRMKTRVTVSFHFSDGFLKLDVLQQLEWLASVSSGRVAGITREPRRVCPRGSSEE